jgi:hypothetical protein
MEPFRSREPAYVGATAGLAWFVPRRRESASALGNRHSDAEQPLGTARGTINLTSPIVFSRMRRGAVPRTGPIPNTPSLPLTRLARTRTAQIKSDICALRPAKTPRCRSRALRGRRRVDCAPRRLIRYPTLPPFKLLSNT